MLVGWPMLQLDLDAWIWKHNMISCIKTKPKDEKTSVYLLVFSGRSLGSLEPSVRQSEWLGSCRVDWFLIIVNQTKEN